MQPELQSQEAKVDAQSGIHHFNAHHISPAENKKLSKVRSSFASSLQFLKQQHEATTNSNKNPEKKTKSDTPTPNSKPPVIQLSTAQSKLKIRSSLHKKEKRKKEAFSGSIMQTQH